MAWYQDATRKTHVATYKSEVGMRSDVEAASKFGFVSQGIARSGNQWTVTFNRDEHAWARIKVEMATANLERERSKLAQAKSAVEVGVERLGTAYSSAHMLISNPSQLEKALLKSINTLISARHAANTQRHALLSAISALQTARSDAETINGKVEYSGDTLELDGATITNELNAETSQLQREQPTPDYQQSVISAVQTWQQIVADRWEAHALHARALAADTSSASSAPRFETILVRVMSSLRELGRSVGERWDLFLKGRKSLVGTVQVAPSASDSRLGNHQADQVNLQARLEALKAQLESSEAELLRKLQTRDDYMAKLVS